MTTLPKILIVDDDLDILSVMQMLFKIKGYDVTIISKGDEVFEKVETFHPDVVLLDVLLSGSDGQIICKQLKHQSKTRNLPIIMISANPGAAKAIHDYGADDFIHKPFELNELIETINAHLNKRK